MSGPARIAACLLLLLAGARSAGAQFCSGPYRVEQAFPTAGPEETRWDVCWQMDTRYGLIITSASFRKTPASPWVRVLYEGRIAELHVIYNQGTEYFDVTGITPRAAT